MSRTRKDSQFGRGRGTRLEIVKRGDGSFDLWLNRELEQRNVAEKYVPEWLCVRFGFCGEEYTKIMGEVHAKGRSIVEF